MNFDWLSDDLGAPEYRISPGSVSRQERFVEEKRKLSSAFSTVLVDETLGIIERLAGSIEPIPGVIRDFEIVVPPIYPSGPPEAHSVGWPLSGPHTYSRTHMCLWRENDWRKRHTLAYAVAKTFVWIHKHEVYLDSGAWPGNEQIH